MLEKAIINQLEKNNFVIPLEIIEKLQISIGSSTIYLIDFINILIDDRIKNYKEEL